MEKIKIVQHQWVVELMPELGGAISLCCFDGQDMLRPALDNPGEARDTSCFPLVPFSNRIENGVFEFGGRRITLPKNMGDHPHPLHGQGWRAPWQIAAQAKGSATLTYRHEPDSWPWRYEARQDFDLTPDCLVVRLGVTNLSEEPMPAGLGLHPYFQRNTGTTLHTGLSNMLESTDQQIPIRLVPLPPELDFSRGLKIDDLDLDHCFTGWDKDALITWPGRVYRLHMQGDEDLTHLVVYTPKGADFFCVEGVENMNNAFNWMDRGIDTGLKILKPGESHSVTTIFKVEPAA